MYNGIGLATARGSGTNGHVQRNLSFVRQGKKDNVKYKTEAELAKADAINNRGPNEEILEHERKRKIEVKVLEFEEILEEQNYTADEIAAKVQAYREKLLGENHSEQLPKDEFGRYAVRDTHQIAAAKHEKNAMLRSAFGISEYFVEGSSFDADRKAKEELAKSAALQKELEGQQEQNVDKNKKYKLVRTPSRERDSMATEKNGQRSDENKGKPSKSGEENSKRKNGDKSNNSQSKKKKKSDTTDDSSSSSDEDSRMKKSRRHKRKHSSNSDSASDSSDSNSELSKKRKRRDQTKNKKKRSDHSKKSKKHRRHSTSSSSTSDSDSSSSSSSSSSTLSSSSSSDESEKPKHRRR